MNAIQSEKKNKQKIRLTISQTLEQSCEDCPIAKGKSAKSRYKYCGTECPIGQKLKGLGQELTALQEVKTEWTIEEDFYLVKNYPFYTTLQLAEKLEKPFEEIRMRFKYLIAKAETTTGSSFSGLRS